MKETLFNALLNEAQKVHAHPDISAFCPFPTDLIYQDLPSHHINAARLMEADSDLSTTPDLAAFRDAWVAASPVAPWRETYKNTAIGDDFLTRFGCYELIGAGGPFNSDQMRSFVVYMPAGLWYTWHHHPAEELYHVIAGEAEFLLEGETPRTLRPGDSAFHPTNRPHAMRTHDKPVMAYVLWRGDLQTAPVLSDPKGTT